MTQRRWTLLAALLSVLAIGLVAGAVVHVPSAGRPSAAESLLLPASDGAHYRTLGPADHEAQKAGRVSCSGTGRDGDRVQAVYVHAVGARDRLRSVATQLRRDAVWADGVFEASARQTGGHRHLRFATSSGRPGCYLTFMDVPVATTSPATAVFAELALAGLTDPTRHYLVWVDGGSSCGQATLYRDERPGAENYNNTLPGYALVFRTCWGTAEPHELAHTFGGVQESSPHSNGAGHCSDGPDVMCTYTGGASTSAGALSGAKTHGCSWVRLDCGHDDYFSTAPTGWLASHWNAAHSSWLYGGDPAPRVAPQPSSPSPTPSTVAAAPAPAGDPSPAPASSSPSLLPGVLGDTPTATQVGGGDLP